ncbi:A/G-specific adenine glycosylase [Leptospira wolffii]|uniref:Adenine DNA glycosylase n=1 Tax=Leptospira wolffii TaxID=409998 RepID=A0ABV5BL65_9LEPT|nr:A/G-specific adenine glycosylase [Leptospira wolffii]TGL46401.1 A/G-specific adenine glycosylase [Leptospira wolffii]
MPVVSQKSPFEEGIFHSKVREKLRNWFRKEKRDLSFRRNRSPYSTWVSEIMLQQTRVSAMLPLYDAFLKRFPSPQALALADEEEVLRYWKGLGYYSRARNLRAGVQKLVRDFGGEFPRSLEDALSLPGIGPYTARAVLSISYGLPFAVLDGNAKRVLSRLSLFRENGAKSDLVLQEIADRFLDPKYPGEHNEAIMELGARICLPRPLCSDCPLSEDCAAYREGVQESIPPTEKKTKEVPLTIRFFLVHGKKGILLLRYPQRRFFKTIYSLPYSWEGNSPYDPDPIAKLFDSLGDCGIQFKHTITHHKIVGRVSETRLDASGEKYVSERIEKIHPNSETKWCDWDSLETEFPSSVAQKIKKAFAKRESELPGLEKSYRKGKQNRGAE